MPVFNEAPTVAQVIRNVLQQPPVRELIVVDDASSDGTREIVQAEAAKDARVRLLRHERNRGKGAALRAGFAQATSPLVLAQDADLEYDPGEYPLLLQPILSDKADVVYGSRFLGAGAHRVLYFWHSVGNKGLTLLSNMATNLNLSDIETGSKVFRRDVIRQLQLVEDRFGIEPEITAKISRLNVRIYEVPISYHGRTYAEGKKIGWRDGVYALWCIVKYNWLSPQQSPRHEPS
jgi:glycosyltransferase involved in cell wall biosynthesis